MLQKWEPVEALQWDSADERRPVCGWMTERLKERWDKVRKLTISLHPWCLMQAWTNAEMQELQPEPIPQSQEHQNLTLIQTHSSNHYSGWMYETRMAQSHTRGADHHCIPIASWSRWVRRQRLDVWTPQPSPCCRTNLFWKCLLSLQSWNLHFPGTDQGWLNVSLPQKLAITSIIRAPSLSHTVGGHTLSRLAAHGKWACCRADSIRDP